MITWDFQDIGWNRNCDNFVMPAQLHCFRLLLHAFFFLTIINSLPWFCEAVYGPYKPDLHHLSYNTSLPMPITLSARMHQVNDCDEQLPKPSSKWNLHGTPGDGYYIEVQMGTPPQKVRDPNSNNTLFFSDSWFHKFTSI